MKKSFSGMLVAALAVVGVLGTSGNANAALLIHFDNILFDGGTISALPGGNYSGSNIIFDSIYLADDSSGSPVSIAGLQCGSAVATPGAPYAGTCSMDFNTASNTLAIEAGTTGVYGIGADLLPYTADRGALIAGAGATLLTGSFAGFVNSPIGGGFNLFIGGGQNTVSPALLTFFGLPPDAYVFANTAISSNATGAVSESDLVTTAVPEPATMMLLGTGLLAAFRARRKSA